ncbi:anthranilate N-methyltransferase-like [Rosa rugosa]|uniref:anthranilate N-methyltransferase-like n=1 Tax=Rosa rugosa TaxID=74645 RepID=UPI002B403FA4|nr:anthranilate N-methyltransferase-like [Rosa rugosa]
MASSLETKPQAIVLDDERKQEEESFHYAVQLVVSSALPMSMQSAIELGLFDIIARAGSGVGLSASQIAAQIGTQNPEAAFMLDRILRLLATHSVLGCSLVDGQRLYRLSAVSKHFVTEDGVSLGFVMALFQDKVFINSWSQLKDAVIEGGIPFERFHGMPTFEYSGSDQRFNQVFNTAMFNHTTLVVKRILDLYSGFEHLGELVDVGGGLGVALSLITSRYPHIKGINYDLPHVIKYAHPSPGVEHVGGDMFAHVPSGDAIFLKGILHDWTDEDCIKLLKNCYSATPDDGKVIVLEAVLPVLPETSTTEKITTQLDVLMMTQCPGGKERTQQEFMDLATGAGFSGIKYECFVANIWVMEFIK